MKNICNQCTLYRPTFYLHCDKLCAFASGLYRHRHQDLDLRVVDDNLIGLALQDIKDDGYDYDDEGAVVQRTTKNTIVFAVIILIVVTIRYCTFLVLCYTRSAN